MNKETERAIEAMAEEHWEMSSVIGFSAMEAVKSDFKTGAKAGIALEKKRFKKLLDILAEEYGLCAECLEGKLDGYTICGDCAMEF